MSETLILDPVLDLKAVGGRHADLLVRTGLYADMWRRQQEAAAEAEHQVEEPPSFRAEGHLHVAD